MKLYHYAPQQNTIMTDGLISFAGGCGDIRPYIKRAGSQNRQDIITWMENCFPGRSRSLSVITEPVQWQGNDPMLKEFVDTHTLFSIELDDLLHDNLIESIWCQENNALFKIIPSEIDTSPLPWKNCSRRQGLFFGVIRHYFLVLRDGRISPNYLKKENTP